MPPVLAWLRCIGEDQASEWSLLLEALKRLGVEFTPADAKDANAPGVILLSGSLTLALPTVQVLTRSGEIPVIVIAATRRALGNEGHWGLLEAGAADVLIREESEACAAGVAARLQRFAEIEQLAAARVVRENLVGHSEAWRRTVRQIVEVARFSTAPILITGESGTGKELVARLVHTLDPRPEKRNLVVLDCTTVSPELAGSEFFGHERGSFTNAIASREGVFAQADGGTLFLDEVGELPPALQAELLRSTQEGTYKRVGSNEWKQVSFRLVCATNRDLEAEGARGNFRLDFFHRIACARCHLPALRERREDILPLARHFLRDADGTQTPGTMDFDQGVQDFLVTREYPGNVRELRQLVRRIALRHVGPGPITVGSIPAEDRRTALQTSRQDWRGNGFESALRLALAGGAGLQMIREQTAETLIDIALRDAGGNVRRAAERLGVTDRALQMRRAAKHEHASTPATGTENKRLPPGPPPEPAGSGGGHFRRQP